MDEIGPIANLDSLDILNLMMRSVDGAKNIYK